MFTKEKITLVAKKEKKEARFVQEGEGRTGNKSKSSGKGRE